MNRKRYLAVILFLILLVICIFGNGVYLFAQTEDQTTTSDETMGQSLTSEKTPSKADKEEKSKKDKEEDNKPKEVTEEKGTSLVTWFLFGTALLFMLIMVITSTRIVPQGYAGVVERLGRYVSTEDPGLVFLVPMVSRMRLVNLKEQVDEYAPQDVITSDNVTVKIDAVLFFRIVNPSKVLYEIHNYFVAMEKLTMTALRDIIGEMSLDQCLTSRERINARLRGILDDATEDWGIKATRVEIRAIEPPEDIRLAMEKQMRAERDKRASILEAEGAKLSSILRAEGDKQSRVLEAEGEKQSSVLKAQGRAEAYEELFGALRRIGIDDKVIAIRYLEALEKMADGKASKLFLPYEASGVISALSGIADIFKKKDDGGPDTVGVK